MEKLKHRYHLPVPPSSRNARNPHTHTSDGSQMHRGVSGQSQLPRNMETHLFQEGKPSTLSSLLTPCPPFLGGNPVRRGGPWQQCLGSASLGEGKRTGPPRERTRTGPSGNVTCLVVLSAMGIARGFPFSLPLADRRAALLGGYEQLPCLLTLCRFLWGSAESWPFCLCIPRMSSGPASPPPA